jgi:hypothetical protein
MHFPELWDAPYINLQASGPTNSLSLTNNPALIHLANEL